MRILDKKYSIYELAYFCDYLYANTLSAEKLP